MKSFELIGPDGIPDLPYPAEDATSLARRAANFVLRFVHQGYYRDTYQNKIPLADLPGYLNVYEAPSPYVGYTKYIQDNFERFSEGWIPISFEEYKESEEWENYCDAAGGDDEDPEIRPSSAPAQHWELLGEVGVDSAKLMITDPAYIGSEWLGSGKPRMPYFKHEDGTLLYCELHSTAPAAEAIGFDNFEQVIDRYGVTVNELRRSGKLTEMLSGEVCAGDFSSAGCFETVEGDNQGGQLYYRAGHAGAGVVFRTGYGDGVYPVFARYAPDDICGGRRIAEVRVVFIEEEATPAYMRQLCAQTDTTPDQWAPEDGPATGVGVDLWFSHVDGVRTAYVNIDQDNVTIEVKPD